MGQQKRSTILNQIRRFLEKLKSIALSPFRFFAFLCFITGFMVISTAAGIGVYTYSFYRSLPDLKSMKFQQLKKRGVARVQKKMDRKSFYRWIDLDSIHRDYLYSIVMSEDGSFFEHEGIDVDAMLNSLAYNLLKKEYRYGASTITQQVVKNLFLTQEKTIIRKIKELILTERLEKYFSKNQILELYLNIAEFGPDIFGVYAASKEYFRKHPSKINAAEGAFIALMLPSPKRYHYAIFQNQNLSASRRKKLRRILNDMFANEFISYRQYRHYLKYDFFKHSPFKRSRHHSGSRGLAGSKKRIRR